MAPRAEFFAQSLAQTGATQSKSADCFHIVDTDEQLCHSNVGTSPGSNIVS
jgi:hypothetical protein